MLPRVFKLMTFQRLQLQLPILLILHLRIQQQITA